MCMHVYECICVCVCIQICVCMYMCMYSYVHLYVRVCMCVYVHGATNIVQIMLISFNSCSFLFKYELLT